MGMERLDVTAEATIQRGQIQSFVVTFNEENVQRLQAAGPPS